MHEHVIPIESILPQEQLVVNWVKGTNQRFNSALMKLSNCYGAKTGFEKIKGGKVFTGNGWGDDAAVAYGKALKTNFPFVQNLELNVLMQPKGAAHTVLSFSLGKEWYFLDPTYGQVNKTPNAVIMDNKKRMSEFYTPREATYAEIEELVYDYEQDNISYTVTNRSCITVDFTSAQKTHAVNSFVNVNGHHVIPQQYLYNALMQPLAV